MTSPLQRSTALRAFTGAAATITLALMAGCGAGMGAPNSAQPFAAVRGAAMGGHQPVSLAAIRLYGATTSGYGGAPTLLGSANTDSNGNFTITPSGNSCTDPDQVYMVAIGGNTGAGVNASSVLVAALGTCSSVKSSTVVTINEESTIAAAYALSGFANVLGANSNPTYYIGTSTTNKIGLTSAFNNAANLSTIRGAALATTPAGNGAVPQALINSLANSLAACVNSPGLASTNCSNLQVAYPNGVTPSSTWDIALEWALYPTTNVAAVYNNASAQTQFYLPAMSAQPADLSIGIGYTAGLAADGITPVTNPYSLAIDASDNIWVSGMIGAPLVKLGSNGALKTPNGGVGDATFQAFANIRNVAVDIATNPNRVWVASYDGNLYGYNATSGGYTSVALSGSETINTGTSSTAVTAPTGAWTVAIDPSNNVWFGTQTATIGKTNVIGQLLNNGDGTFTQRVSWVGNNVMSLSAMTLGSNYLGVNPFNNEIASTQVGVVGTSYMAGPTGTVAVTLTNYAAGTGVAFDGSSNLYDGGSGLGSGNGKFNSWSSTGIANYVNVQYGGTLKSTTFAGLAIDGSGTAYISTIAGSGAPLGTSGPGTILPYDTTLKTYTTTSVTGGFSPADATGTGSLLLANGQTVKNIQIDQAGALWLANSTAGATYPVVQILGPAMPTIAPLAAGYAAKP